MNRLAWFGGSFNPVHCGHINLAKSLLNQLSLDHIYFLPTWCNLGKNVIAAYHRLAMLRIALAQEDSSRISIDTREIDRRNVTFTIDTLRELRQQQPNEQINFIIGEDSLATLYSWKEYLNLTDYANILVLDRMGSDRSYRESSWFRDNQVKFKIWQQTTHGGIQLCQTEAIDCSSTMIRKAIKQGVKITALVPAEVADYIYKEKLYRDA